MKDGGQVSAPQPANNRLAGTTVVADTQPLFAEGVRAMVDGADEFTVVSCVSTIADLHESVERAKPAFAVLDMKLEGGSSFEQLSRIRSASPETKIILLAAELDAAAAIDAVRHDVHGLLLKTMPADLLIACLRKVAAGGRWVEMRSLGSAIERMLATDQAQQSAKALLSDRELEMVRFVCRGLRNKEIATRAHVSEGTVKTHLHNIYQKVGVSSRLALMRVAQERGWVAEHAD